MSDRDHPPVILKVDVVALIRNATQMTTRHANMLTFESVDLLFRPTLLYQHAERFM